MRYLLLACLLLCCALSGCSHLWEENGGRAVNLFPTVEESRGGDR